MTVENREFAQEVLEEIQCRWSPRAFDPEKTVAKQDLVGLMEAARYAPSCVNQQPWSYIIGQRGNEVYEKIKASLTASNQEWAVNAAVLMVIVSKQNFDRKNRPNRWHLFDAGTSWGYLSLEAQRRGLITHAIGGFNVEEVREAFAVPDDYTIVAAVAVGHHGRKEDLSEELAEQERPSPRKDMDDMFFVPLLDME